MADSLKTGAAALLAFQRAIATTSHNIANSATEGYTRQSVEFEASPSVRRNYGYTGQGVGISQIRRMEDQFAESQLVQTGSELARLTTLNQYSTQVDTLFADSNLSLTPAINSFFSSLTNASNDPTDASGRANVLNEAENLAGKFSALYQELESVTNQAGVDIASSVDEINALTRQIGELNKSIVDAGNSRGQTPNDLLDQRNRLVERLSEQVGITTIEADNGALDVYVANGQSLLTGYKNRELHVVPHEASSARVQIAIVDANNLQIIGNQLSGGKLGGLVEINRTMLTPTINDLGRMAFVLSDAINTQHALGIDTMGAYGQNLFGTPMVHVAANADNTGTATLTANVNNTSNLTNSDYAMEFDGVNYTLSRLSDNTSVSGGTVLTMDGMTVTVSGTMLAGDAFTIAPTRYAARDISVSLTAGEQLALGSPLRTDTALSNTGYAKVGLVGIVDPSNPDFNTAIDIVINDPPTSYNLIERDTGTVLSTNISYGENDLVTLNGWEVQLTGAAAAGDTFTIEQNIAGISSNENAHQMSDIYNRALFGNDSSLADTYGTLISNVGSRTRQTELTRNSMQSMHNNAIERRENTSGVNLDEEAINLTRYQQAYQASAQVINTADQLFQTLLGAIR